MRQAVQCVVSKSPQQYIKKTFETSHDAIGLQIFNARPHNASLQTQSSIQASTRGQGGWQGMVLDTRHQLGSPGA